MTLSFAILTIQSPALSSAGDRAVKKVHTVVKKDTLWDLSEKYLGNPFLWPKLWQWNEYITNPHFIYPGNRVNLYPPEVMVKHPPQKPAPEIIEVTEPEQEVVSTEAAVEGPKFIFPELRSTGLVSLYEMEKAGKILNAEDEKVMLSTGDTVYVTMKDKPGQGDMYTVFKVQRKIVHPVTGEKLGFKVSILGAMEIESFNKGLATAQITTAYDEISRGNPVMKQPEMPESIGIVLSESSLEGYIIATKEEQKTFGENDIVYIDLGKEDGIVAGNSFIVYKKGELVREKETKKEYTLPSTTIGRLLVIDVKENTAAAIIIDSAEEMHVGERIRAEIK